MSGNAIITEHALDFESAPYELNLDKNVNWRRFRIGTCKGLFSCNEESFEILAVTNDKPNNGHFTDVLQWFENSCKTYNRNLKITEIMNFKFKKHLIDKRGFVELSDNEVIKKKFN